MNKKISVLGLIGVSLIPLSVCAADVGLESSGQPAGLPMLANTNASQIGAGSAKYDGMTFSNVMSVQRSAAVLPEFSKYVAESVGENLSLYGASFFSQSPSTFAPSQGQNVFDDYAIGVGDELQIRGWGMVDIDLLAKVDRNGTIYIPRVGNIAVAGVKFKDLQGHLKKSISRIFTNFELTVSLSQTRDIQVFVTGFARQPGSYQVSALSTVVNTLFAVGGPAPEGSMRRVEIKRSGKTIGTFDLYAFIAEGSKAGDISLQDGDIIHIPAMGNVVALSGLVKQPALYETLPSETVASIVKRAGGVQPEAEQSALQIEIAEKGWMRPLESASDYVGIAGLLKATAGTPLRQGGIYRVSSPESAALRANITQQYVKVDGEVNHPGVYKLQKGETLRDLIARIGGVSEDAYLYGMVLSRPSIRDQQQKALDAAVDRFEKESEAAAAVKLSSTTLSETAVLAQAELERNRRRAQAMRKVQAVGRVALEFNDYRIRLKDLPDLSLENGDAIYIPRQPGTVNVFGAVNNAAAFMFKQNRRVSDYLTLAGGMSRNADQDEIYLLKADGTALNRSSGGWFSSVNGYKLAPGDSIVVPEAIERGVGFTQSLKEWTTILYQFGLGAAGLKVLKN
jgi:protein involved in polysaccharide export with SLBB domain